MSSLNESLSGGHGTTPAPARLTDADKQMLLQLARDSVQRIASCQSPPEPDPTQLPEPLLANRCCFVTLFKRHDLRGCIGNILARHPLYHAVIESAEGAASRDPRFPPVRPDEVSRLRIEISVLTELQPLPKGPEHDLLHLLTPGTHGVVLKLHDRFCTFLPQVWEHLPNKLQFLERLSQKGGFGPNGWRDPDATLLVYETESFEERDEQA